LPYIGTFHYPSVSDGHILKVLGKPDHLRGRRMLSVLRASALAVAVVFFVPNAEAEDYGPSDTATFVSSCATDFEACRNEVLTISNYNKMAQLTGSPYPGCTFPHTQATFHNDSIAGTNAIIDWLKANITTAAPKTDDAISQAMKALWPNLCKP
jgi:hypothetical protein